MKQFPTLELENAHFAETGSPLIAGLDEAGRGALAGPVVAAAVILPLENEAALAALTAVNDSKLLTPKRRDNLFDLIIKHALCYGIGSASAAVIDQIGIIAATKQAMKTAVSQLKPAPTFLLIDGRIRLTSLLTPQQAIIRGDAKSRSIAAASILAKVTRDRHMVALHPQHPVYRFDQHKGYGTAVHRAAIAQHGATAVHRHTFAPMQNQHSLFRKAFSEK